MKKYFNSILYCSIGITNILIANEADFLNPANLYLELMKKSILNTIYKDPDYNRKLFDSSTREVGGGWPQTAHSMIGMKRMDNIQYCLEDIIKNDVPGDTIETGVWRGGACIFMRAILKAYNDTSRKVWVADSFEGLPRPNIKKYPQDKGLDLSVCKELAISLDQVKDNFKAYGLLDDQVSFLKGWFSKTLPKAPINKLSLLRLDGDLYESTMDALVHLYPKLSIGGYIIIDDYGCIEACRQAVHDYRKANNINDEIRSIDWTGVFWQKTQ